MRTSQTSGFTLIEAICGIVLFAGVAYGAFSLATSSQRFSTEANSAAGQNAYTNLQAQIALHGLDPTRLGNINTGALVDPANGTEVPTAPGTSSDQRGMSFIRGQVARFETGAIKNASGANRSLGGSANRSLVNYQADAVGGQTSKGVGLGYAITANAAVLPTATMKLVPPVFNIAGDISGAAFPLNNIVQYPSANPPGTVYRYTTDGSIPQASSPLWVNDPAWTVGSFPFQIQVRAFHSDPQYTASDPVGTTYIYGLSLAYSRADGRGAGLFAFSLSELGTPATSGVVLTSNVPGVTIRFSTDGSDPSIGGQTYTGAFPPPQARFTPTMLLRAVAVSSDPRFVSSPVTSFTLSPNAVNLPAPVIATSNVGVLPSGSTVTISFTYSGASTRSELNANPTPTSTSNTTLALD